MIFNNLSDILNYLPTGTLTFHWQISGKRSTVFNNYKMSICDQVHLQKFWHTWHTWKILKKIGIQIHQFWNLYCNIVESFVRPKICKILSFAWMDFCKLPLRKNSARQRQNFISFNSTNKLRLPTWIYDVMSYF